MSLHRAPLRSPPATLLVLGASFFTNPSAQTLFYSDVSDTHLPAGLEGPTLDGAVGDIDGDGDLDIAVACEECNNTILLNDGTGKFTHTGTERLMERALDSEDVTMADFDGDGDLDLIFVTENGQTNELYLNDGRGAFTDASGRLPAHGASNAVLANDADGDGDIDLFIGNDGQNLLLTNDGAANFTDVTADRLPQVNDATQDLFLADVDGDGDLDLLAANESGSPRGSRLLINDGNGVFAGDTGRMPAELVEETSREVVAADLDRDGDMDVVTFNLGPAAGGGGRSAQNRLLLNDGSGVFTDVTEDRLPDNDAYSWDGALIDVDGDGDLDIVSCSIDYSGGGGRKEGPYQAWLNDGNAGFSNHTGLIFPATAVGFGWDVEAADFNHDGNQDLYFSAKNGENRLLFGTSKVSLPRIVTPAADVVAQPAIPPTALRPRTIAGGPNRGPAPSIGMAAIMRNGHRVDLLGRRMPPHTPGPRLDK